MPCLLFASSGIVENDILDWRSVCPLATSSRNIYTFSDNTMQINEAFILIFKELRLVKFDTALFVNHANANAIGEACLVQDVHPVNPRHFLLSPA